jgi:hypothetical protein
MACVRGYLGDYAGAVQQLWQTTSSLERSKLPRYLLMAHEMLATLLVELDLNELALEASQRGVTLAKSAGITFWHGRREATHAIARMRLGDLGVGAVLTRTLSWARDNDERAHMIRCVEGLAELALRRGEHDACSAYAEEMLSLAESAGMTELRARGHFWHGEALAARGERGDAVEHLTLAASAAETLGRLRLAKDATEALAQASGAPTHRDRASALAARIERSARECERLVTRS